jgi:putative ABC transport system substrate-binding protein
MKRCIHALLASTAFLLISAFWMHPSWAQTKIPRVGVLLPNPPDPRFMGPFYQTLREHGLVDGKSVAFDVRDAGEDSTRYAELAAELVRLKVDVLFPVGPSAVRAAFAATRDIPIVAHDLESDPVAAGYVQSYNRPGGNLTGLFFDSPELAGKWIELLKTIVPRLSRVVAVWDSTSSPVPLDAIRKVAPSFGVKVQVLEIHTPADISKASSAFAGHPQAMIVLPAPMFWIQAARVAQLARKHRLPAVSFAVPFAEAGGLLACGPSMGATTEQCAVLVSKILNGAKPADLPIERPSKFEFVLNLKTASDLHLTVPDRLLLTADRVINK